MSWIQVGFIWLFLTKVVFEHNPWYVLVFCYRLPHQRSWVSASLCREETSCPNFVPNKQTMQICVSAFCLLFYKRIRWISWSMKCNVLAVFSYFANCLQLCFRDLTEVLEWYSLPGLQYNFVVIRKLRISFLLGDHAQPRPGRDEKSESSRCGERVGGAGPAMATAGRPCRRGFRQPRHARSRGRRHRPPRRRLFPRPGGRLRPLRQPHRLQALRLLPLHALLPHPPRSLRPCPAVGMCTGPAAVLHLAPPRPRPPVRRVRVRRWGVRRRGVRVRWRGGRDGGAGHGEPPGVRRRVRVRALVRAPADAARRHGAAASRAPAEERVGAARCPSSPPRPVRLRVRRYSSSILYFPAESLSKLAMDECLIDDFWT
jgi:hypothetical protein